MILCWLDTKLNELSLRFSVCITSNYDNRSLYTLLTINKWDLQISVTRASWTKSAAKTMLTNRSPKSNITTWSCPVSFWQYYFALWSLSFNASRLLLVFSLSYTIHLWKVPGNTEQRRNMHQVSAVYCQAASTMIRNVALITRCNFTQYGILYHTRIK